MNDENELFWAAGFLEGEGCFRGACAPKSLLEVAAKQTYTVEPLERLQQLFGGSIHPVNNEQARAKGRGSRDGYVWNIYGQNAVRAMSRLLPHMSQRRQSQIVKALANYVSVKEEETDGSPS